MQTRLVVLIGVLIASIAGLFAIWPSPPEISPQMKADELVKLDDYMMRRRIFADMTAVVNWQERNWRSLSKPAQHVWAVTMLEVTSEDCHDLANWHAFFKDGSDSGIRIADVQVAYEAMDVPEAWPILSDLQIQGGLSSPDYSLLGNSIGRFKNLACSPEYSQKISKYIRANIDVIVNSYRKK